MCLDAKSLYEIANRVESYGVNMPNPTSRVRVPKYLNKSIQIREVSKWIDK